MKKSEKGFGVAELLIIVIIIGLIAAVGWLVFSRQKVKNSDSSQSNAQTLRPEDVTTQLRSYLAGKYTLTSADDVKAGQVWASLNNNGGPTYKPAGYNFYVNSDGSTLSLAAGPSSAWDVDAPDNPAMGKLTKAVHADVLKELSSLGLKSAGTSYGVGKLQQVIYTGRGLACTVIADVACGNIEHYEGFAAKVQPLTKVVPGFGSTTILSGSIVNSQVSGYQKAELNVGDVYGTGSVQYFYKKGSDPWVYFMGTQDGIDCSAFNTQDLRNAFKGEQCVSGADNGYKLVKLQ